MLIFETSDSNFRDILDELFHMALKIFRKKKSKWQVIFQSPIYFTNFESHIKNLFSKKERFTLEKYNQSLKAKARISRYSPGTTAQPGKGRSEFLGKQYDFQGLRKK